MKKGVRKQVNMMFPWDLWEEIKKVGECWEQESGKAMGNQKLVRSLVRMGLESFKVQNVVPDKHGLVPVTVMVTKEVREDLARGADEMVSVGYSMSVEYRAESAEILEMEEVSDGEG